MPRQTLWIAFRRFALFLALLASSSLAANAQQQPEICPWLNAATAAGVLGEDVRVTVTHPTPSHADQPNGAPADATCDFRPLKPTAAQSLEIAVHTMQDHKQDYPAYLALCDPSPRPLIGVGNQAIACRAVNGPNQVTEKVIARIRERVFVFAWSMPDTEATRSPQAAQAIRDKLQNTAEQIAGSLF